MKNNKRVLVGVDLSDYSKETIESALTLAKGPESEFLLLNVINIRDVDIAQPAGQPDTEQSKVDRYITKTKAARQEKIERILDENFPADKSKCRIIFRVGAPYKKILEAAEEEKAELVVIAGKGRSNLIGTLHGSNAENVFRHSRVPVLCVRRGGAGSA